MIKTNLNKATGNSFELIFPKVPVRSRVSDSESFTMNIHGTVIPSISMNTVDMNWQGGIVSMATAPITFETWFVNFAVDSNFDNWFIMYDWLTLMSNNKTHYDHLRNEYWVDAALKLRDNNDNIIADIVFINLFPTLLNEVALSYRDGYANLESGVNFNYTRYEAKKL